MPLPQSLVGVTSPATVTAYTDWISPFLQQQQMPGWIPLSLSNMASRHAAALLTALLVVVWAAGQLLHSRGAIATLLLVLAIGISLHACFGFWCLVDPILGDVSRNGFGTFVNRNHAALFFNFGLAAGLGLLSWRLSALTGQSVDDGSFEFNDLFSLMNDRDSWIAVITSALCIGGLFACGSRGGIAAACIGGLLAFGWMRQRRGWATIPVVGAVIGISLLLLVVPLNINLKSMQRISDTVQQDKSTLLRSGRLQHWGDGWQTAKAHLPAGSGLSTYAYAYLPHQQTSPEVWFHHADNLWLELIVEQGIVGVVLAAWLLYLLWGALRTLARSADPIDEGFRATGWFAIGAMLCSQCFDFGLIIPGNLLLFAVISAAIIARSGAVVLTDETDQPRQGWLTPRQELVWGRAAAVVMLLATMACLPKLRHDAVCELASRTVDSELPVIVGHEGAMDRRLKSLYELLESTSHPAVLIATAKLEHARARLAEILSTNPATREDVLLAYENTEPAVRRLRWNRIDEDNPSPSEGGYLRSLGLSSRALLELPLNLESRIDQIYLDFVHQDAERTRAALQQLSRLQNRNPTNLMNLAILAADGGDLDIAKAQWQNAVSQDPNLTYEAIAFVKQRTEISLDDVIPNVPDNQRRTSWYLLANASKDPVLKAQAPGFLQRALDKIDCEDCQSKKQRAKCEELTGDILYSLDRPSESFPHYARAIQEQPADANLRVKYIGRLRFAGKNKEALLAARRARRALPNHNKFQRIIEAMAAQDLRDVQEAKRKAAAGDRQPQ